MLIFWAFHRIKFEILFKDDLVLAFILSYKHVCHFLLQTQILFCTFLDELVKVFTVHWAFLNNPFFFCFRWQNPEESSKSKHFFVPMIFFSIVSQTWIKTLKKISTHSRTHMLMQVCFGTFGSDCAWMGAVNPCVTVALQCPGQMFI